MNVDLTLRVAQIVFWILSICAALLPLRYGLSTYVVLSLVDTTGVDFSSLTAIGFANLVKVVVLPSLFYYRLRHTHLSQVSSMPFSKVWVWFCAYAAVASVWTSFHVAALKMIGYLLSYAILFVVLLKGWRKGYITPRSLTVLAWISLLVAVFQTYVLGNPYGTPPNGTPYATQFTTFIDAQSFAPFLLAMLLFQLVLCGKGRMRTISSLTLTVAIVLAGSRYIYVATILGLLVFYLGQRLTDGKGISTRFLLTTAMLAVLLTAVPAWLVLKYFPASRINEVIDTTLSGQESLQNVVDVAYRLKIYSELGQALETRSFGRLLIGSGTSSGPEVRLRFDPTYDETTTDGNRVIHSEFLRALYEWGILGFLLVLVFVLGVSKNCLGSFLRNKNSAALLSLAFLPAILTGLAIENVLAAPARPNGVAYILVLSCFGAFREVKRVTWVRQSRRRNLSPERSRPSLAFPSCAADESPSPEET